MWISLFSIATALAISLSVAATLLQSDEREPIRTH
jgi:hypothetical protein